MIRLVEAMNFRCLKRVRQPLGSFHVLVGPNASGKSSLLDVLAFLNLLVTYGVEAAIQERGTIFDLLWDRGGEVFELAVEAAVPKDRRQPLHLWAGGTAEAIRYEAAVGLGGDGAAKILDEQILLTSAEARISQAPMPRREHTLFADAEDRYWTRLAHRNRSDDGYDIDPETFDPGRPDEEPYTIVYRPKQNGSIFAALSAEEFPTATWLESLLGNDMFRVDLQPEALRRPSPPGHGAAFLRNGSNLPWLVEKLEKEHPRRHQEWIAHLRTALPDIQGIRVVDRPEDRHRYLMLRYANGLELPSWCCSEGTLCLLALTFIAYQSKPGEIWLIEEPESHLHPLNIEPMIQSLSSVYGGQVLISTHSPAILAMTDIANVLAFTRNSVDGTKIIRGNDHPELREWKGEVSLGTLFAGGVLG